MGTYIVKVPKRPGEQEPFSFEYVPGKNIPIGDSLTGSPTVTCKTEPEGADTTTVMISSVSRNGNIVYFILKGGVAEQEYRVTIKSDLAGGGKAIEERLNIRVSDK